MIKTDIHTRIGDDRVRTALLLAAGTGSRLAPLTDLKPKCLIQVNGVSILERLVQSLSSHGFNRLVVVVGHQAECIRDFLGCRAGGMEITYINSPLYATTNNIYSLWLARSVIEEPFLLIESDLVFDAPILEEMLLPDRIAISRLRPWMNGATVTIDDHSHQVKAFWPCASKPHDTQRFKTVNIYSLSTSSWRLIRERLGQHILNNMVNGYYETVFAEMIAEGSLSFTPVFFDDKRWYEIDNMDDFHAAEQLFPRHCRANQQALPPDSRFKFAQSEPLADQEVRLPAKAT